MTAARSDFELWRSLSMCSTPVARPKGLDTLHSAFEHFVHRVTPDSATDRRLATRAMQTFESMRHETEPAIAERLARLRRHARTARFNHATRTEAIALAGLASERTMGMTPRHVQLRGVAAILRGRFAELATGEGKTLVAALAASVEALAGRGCHVITVNDYLAQRDAHWMTPLFNAMGVTVGVVHAQSTPSERREAYRAGVTYCTNKEVVADFLRDTLAEDRAETPLSLLAHRFTTGSRRPSRPPQMREPWSVIVDEADSVLIDEATTPLIISAPPHPDANAPLYVVARRLAGALREGVDFTIQSRHHETLLTRAGRDRLAVLIKRETPSAMTIERRREELVTQALGASHLFLRDRDYVVRSAKIVIVDASTGRMMPDRTWRDGMHQAIQAKEGLPVTGAARTLARISFQRYFQRYPRIAGMSGTITECAPELWRTFRRRVTSIPTHRPVARTHEPVRLYANKRAKLRAVIDRVEEIHRAGRPVLVGSRSVRTSMLIGLMLEQRDIEHRVLNALNHEEEAEIVARAGEPGAITIATNMAGRGTDIKPTPESLRAGGLHVIATELDEAARIERQLFGRSGRQGDPGSAQLMMSLDDECVRAHTPAWFRRALNPHGTTSTPLARWKSLLIRAWVFRGSETLNRKRRAAVARADEFVEDVLGL